MQVCIPTALSLLGAFSAPLWAQVSAVERAVARAEAIGARTGVAVGDASARILYRNRAGEAFAPASNMKLLTAAGVLSGLGRDHRFVTDFRLDEGVLRVSASGDPNWIAGTDHDPARVFGAVAAAIRARGVSSVRAVELAPGAFTGPSRPATWPQDQLYAYYCAPTGPFVLQQGTFVMGIQRSGGASARVALLAPPAGYRVLGAVREVARQKGATYGAIDEGGAVRVRGKFYRKSPRVEIKTSVKDPTRWYEDTLVHQLRLGGVTVAADAPPATQGVVHSHQSSLQPALRRMLEDSSNFDAEQCLRILGAATAGDGSLAGGTRALRVALESLVGRVPEGVELVDGSGLSKQNRLSPGLLVVAMFELERRGLWSQLEDCLPVAGRTGTLRKRFVGSGLEGRVRAKTGWIRGASSLSGVVEAQDGSRRWFSILMNYDRGRSGVNKQLKRLQEDIVAAVAAMPGAQ
ncbi:MAG: D-alanyl-D-alanine carboxypeptidase/D-alanyl-D-alanine endopeptidase [Planctomycetota bacterium]